jgi:hypothetical protein
MKSDYLESFSHLTQQVGGAAGWYRIWVALRSEKLFMI